MKKILILTDNKIQYESIRKLFNKIGNSEIQVDYYKSIKNIDSTLGLEIIDVKNSVDELINNYDLIISMHCLQFFPKELVTKVRCVNIHPGYNPLNRGWYPQVFSIYHNLPIGVTIYEMDEKLDNGPIIAQKFVKKYDWDTSLSLYQRILNEEMVLLSERINDIINNSYSTSLPMGETNFFNKNDFYKICQLDLDEVATFRVFYDKLRALSHGNFKNAYFLNKNGEKIFIKIEISKEESND